MTDLQRIVQLGATTTSEITGTGSPIVSQNWGQWPAAYGPAGTGSPIGSVAAGKGLRILTRPQLLTRTLPLPCSRVREAHPRGTAWVARNRVRRFRSLTSISSTPCGSSARSYGRAPPVLAAVGGATTTSLLRLRHDK